MKSRHIIVIGGGIIGLATAFKISRKIPGARVTVLEKEPFVGQHQSGHNSGVLHAGLYYKPGSLKARLAVSGIREMISFCEENKVPHEICGKLVVAVDQSELGRLEELYTRGQQNGLLGLKKLDAKQMREIEPHVAGIAAVHVPQEGIVDYGKVCAALQRKIEENGGRVLTKSKVIGLRCTQDGWIVQTPGDELASSYLVNCAGLHCDRVSELAGEKREVRIIPFRGEYYKLRAASQHLVRHLIYPVPDPQFPFLGVHFTRSIHGGIEAGPNAVLAFAREGYRKTDFNLRDFADAVSFAGLWKFMGKHKRMSWDEVKRSLSKKLFCKSLQRLVPEVQPEDLERGGAGVRAQAMSPQGDMVQDFSLIQQKRALHVLNAPSPGATASLAIGEEITRMVASDCDA